MFYYYGRKAQLARYYHKPEFSTIIEPFAGSAAYSLYNDNWKKQVILIEKNKRVAEIWKWLINEATSEEIMNMKNLNVGEKTTNFLHILHSASKRAFDYKIITVTPIIATNWNLNKIKMANNLFKVKHWKIICGDYTEAPDIEATWFIDPPYSSDIESMYKIRKKHYISGNDAGTGYEDGSKFINYEKLAEWALKRKGQLIFCEGAYKANYLPLQPFISIPTYLPFQPLKTLVGIAGKRSQELVYYQNN